MSDLAQFSHDQFFNSESYVKNFVIALLDAIPDISDQFYQYLDDDPCNESISHPNDFLTLQYSKVLTKIPGHRIIFVIN